jgi:hypothetical protein
VPEASRLQRFLLFALPALALFACVGVTRVFIAADVVALGLRMTGLKSIAAVAVVGGPPFAAARLRIRAAGRATGGQARAAVAFAASSSSSSSRR